MATNWPSRIQIRVCSENSDALERNLAVVLSSNLDVFRLIERIRRMLLQTAALKRMSSLVCKETETQRSKEASRRDLDLDLASENGNRC